VTTGDGGEMLPPCYGGSGGARTAATPPTDRRSVACPRVRRRDGANLRCLGQGACRGPGGSGSAHLGRRSASGGAGANARAGDARRMGARDVSVHRRSALIRFAGALFDSNFLQNFE
jgi:hypothetical protein